MRTHSLFIFLFAMTILACNGCKNDPKNVEPPVVSTPPKPVNQVAVPTFDAESAFEFVKKQVEFGPRVPGSAAHKKCGDYLAGEFRRFGLTVVEQKFQAKTYFATLDACNIIGQYKPELPNRILLCAHWDTRHIADADTKDKDKPILGADDGGSGVAILLEMARLLQANPLEIGVDFVLFDAEDLGDNREKYGSDSPLKTSSAEMTEKTWCLGSQHWASNPHKPGYSAQFGILFDMVGAIGAQFPREGYSIINALSVQDKIWKLAGQMGYGDVFLNKEGGAITDDHIFVMKKLPIPIVDIIGMPNGFGKHWHTHDDNLDVIDKSVLKAVGQVTAAMVYRTYNQNI